MSTVTATVEKAMPLGSEIKSFRLSAPGALFAAASPGAHVDVSVPNGLNRQYSLWDWSDDGTWGAIGVKNETEGRGGSTWLHENLKPGSTIEIGAIRNNFALDETAEGHILIAGGIGVTPLVAMARRLKSLRKPFTFYYLARNAAAAGFQDVLTDLDLGDALHVHLDDRDGVFDIDAALAEADEPAPVYFCGPETLLKAMQKATEDWDTSRVHYELFSVDPAAADGPSEGFEVELAQTGETVHVPADRSILDVLIDAGVDPDFGCTEGVCGACTSSVIEGEVDHRDATKNPEDHDTDGTMCICVSRAKGSKLVLDI